jgi:subtilisin family serine protease
MLELSTATTAPGTGSSSGRVQIQQAALIQSLTAINAQVLFTTNLALKAVAVAVPANQVDRLRQLPGVSRVSIIPPKSPAGTAARSSAGLPAIASAVANATGAGVRIGIIDRGIDYTHADFGGAGTPAAYAANDPTTREPGSFPTGKVIEGFDFAGDGYDASGANGSVIPAPDPDPLECNQPLIGAVPNPSNGEGTHVAGLAAGFGVAADGTTFYGPYDPGTDYSGFKVAPGVAPEAQIYALKVFGCAGSSALLTAAINRAIDPNDNGLPEDHLDVLVISLGTPFGGADDPDAIAVDNAVRAGVVVVIAAGDSINTFYSINSPASAQLAIAVGAAGNGQPIANNSARGPLRGNSILKPDIIAPGVDIRSAAVASGVDAQTMSGTAIAAPQVAGAAALLRQTHATWTPAQIKAALMNSATPTAGPPSLAGAGLLNVASVGGVDLLAYNADGTSGGITYGAAWVAAASTTTRTLQLENTGDMARQISLSATAVATETGVTVSLPPGPITVPAHGSTQAIIDLSIDPSGLEFTPDAATQPTQNNHGRHYLAEHGGYIQVNGIGDVSGTRVRPAHAAHFPSVDVYIDDILLKRSLDSREVKAYIDIAPGPHVVKLRADESSPTSRVLFSAPVNLLDGHDYTVAIVGRPGALGIVTIDETTVVAPAAGQALIHFVNANRAERNWDFDALDVYLDGVLRFSTLGLGETTPYISIPEGEHLVSFYETDDDPARSSRVAFKRFVATAGTAILVGTGRHDDDDGSITDSEQRCFIGVSIPRVNATRLASVPFDVFPTVASDAHAMTAGLVPAGAQSFTVGIQNAGARNAPMAGSLGTPRTPLASAFELEATSPALTVLSPTLRAADIRYVGVTSGYSVTQNMEPDTLLFFGLATYAPWSTPNEIQFQVYIDSDQDGHDDFVLVNVNSNTRDGGPPTDTFLNGLYPIRADGTLASATRIADWGSFTAPISSSINMAPFNTSVMFETALVKDLAIPVNPDDPFGPKGPVPERFCYHIETRARDFNLFGQVLDRVPDAASAPVAACANRSGVLLYDIAGATLKPINSTSPVFGSPLSARPIFVDVDGGQITGGVNAAALATQGAQLLIFHHHNAPFPQAEVIDITTQAAISQLAAYQARAYLPFVFR